MHQLTLFGTHPGLGLLAGLFVKACILSCPTLRSSAGLLTPRAEKAFEMSPAHEPSTWLQAEGGDWADTAWLATAGQQ